MSDRIEIWDLWFPDAAAQGLPFARGRMRAAEILLVHAAPATLRVDVVDEQGRLLARGAGLERTAETPIARLTRRGQRIEREDIWPGERDIGRPVILAGGEIGILMAWWNDERQQEWRWSIDLYNHK
jgi:hypothetical protein